MTLRAVESMLNHEWRRPRATDDRRRPFPQLVLIAGGATALIGAGAIGAVGYMYFRDDVLRGLIDRQIEMQYAYEDRLAAERLRLDQATSRQMLDQDSVEGKIDKLVLRETRLETRAVAVAELVQRLAREAGLQGVSRQAKAPPGFAAAPTRATAEAYAPPAPAKPQPEAMDLRLGDEPASDAPAQGPKGADRAALSPAAASRPSGGLAAAADPGLPMEARLAGLARSLDETERDQALRLAAVARPAMAAASRLRRVFDIAGLSAAGFARSPGPEAPGAMGGPYVAVDDRSPAATAFLRDLAAARSAVGEIDGLRRALPSLPLRKPLEGELRLTSGFGYRIDPFLGKPALHSGVDLLDEYGEPVCAAAGGTVVAAGPSGGYGNMVEIDHGSGFSTRYGHLSQIDVAPGQSVEPGAVLGRVGSTGRSTGAHLHYEVRAEGEPVDPARFLRAAAALDAMRE